MISGNSKIRKSDCVLLSIFPSASSKCMCELDWPLNHFMHLMICMANVNFLINVLAVFLSDTLKFCFAKCLISPSHCLLDAVRKSISEAFISSPHADPPVPSEPSEFPTRKLSVKSQTCQDLGSHSRSTSHSAPLLSECTVCHA